MFGLPRPSVFGNLRVNKEVRMNKKYLVRLTDEGRAICEAIIKKETGKSEKLRRATILLKADADGPAWDDAKIGEAIGCRTRTVENVRRAFVLDGFEAALVRKKRATSPTPKWLDGAAEAKVIAMRLGKPPAGFGHWTLRLLADRVVELEVVESISPETVRQTLKKLGRQTRLVPEVVALAGFRSSRRATRWARPPSNSSRRSPATCPRSGRPVHTATDRCGPTTRTAAPSPLGTASLD